jgi:hypothetical protein
MLNALHHRYTILVWCLRNLPLCLAEHFIGNQGEAVLFGEQNVKGRFELEAGFEDCAAAEDVQTEASAGEGDGEAADVAEVADRAGAD